MADKESRGETVWVQQQIRLTDRGRGCHHITPDVEQALEQTMGLRKFDVGVAHLFLQASTASLALSDRFDPAARYDTEAALSSLIPEKSDIWTRICEGSDDMPALVKNCLVGCNLTIPISNGILNTGHGQGIWLLEHKNYGGGRKLVITVQGMYKPTFNKPLGSLGL
ncbi:UPF0047 protein YjbQ-like [Branchiostoma floridae]|uniref:UPF0047 protein YjbQ-like n=1 Tax=Branchiostoma floridae TaxID=7739 RepID=A0A9J7MUU3_BRAFL|nr:UPF0047 protein YjbQ-like [Branchiostoma floridae]